MKMTKMMKRILACAAVMAMIFSLTACGGSQAQTAAEPAAAEEQKEAETPADAAEPVTKPEEKYSFEGITVIPFCTSGSSGIGRSGPNMEELAGSGTWLDGQRFSGGVSEEELQSWIEGMK